MLRSLGYKYEYQTILVFSPRVVLLLLVPGARDHGFIGPACRLELLIVNTSHELIWKLGVMALNYAGTWFINSLSWCI